MFSERKALKHSSSRLTDPSWPLDGPRFFQIRDIIEAGTTNGLAIGVFLLLTLQNVCATIQAWVLSSEKSYFIGA